eukprot:632812-Amorphochlora_amoeboformis.AAC.1
MLVLRIPARACLDRTDRPPPSPVPRSPRRPINGEGGEFLERCPSSEARSCGDVGDLGDLGDRGEPWLSAPKTSLALVDLPALGERRARGDEGISRPPSDE